MARIVALFILVIPAVLAGYGIKLMRDALFAVQNPFFINLPLQMIAGLLFFIGGLSFVAGFIFHRDRKRNKLQNRFKKNV
ncbi:DUF2627 domain-containing protein [Bacillus sp. HMF5848]|uniref:DUF2627 domain-containing protein n=1 Tax=Bacillus sp. HMF5848 TaxID=2495421 RepID=UPI000F775F96|nr:DUF2627 domain-containing protein [Bacillus sp. HMF5848]RSK27783.1 DUF2627 domain-containing protein [Bacillus sp. HMF5848]